LHTYTIITDRKMSKCTGSDPYIELKNVNNFKDIWININNSSIMRINDDEINKSGNKFEFNLLDNLTKKRYTSNISKLSNGIRFRIGDYCDDVGLFPDQILHIHFSVDGTNCFLSIQVENYYRYILKKIPNSSNYYNEQENCDKMNVSQYRETFLNQFSITDVGESEPIGRSALKYRMFNVENCTKKYIGVPYSTELELDEFDSIEEIS